MAIEPLHSSKLLMCAQRVQRGGVCEKKRAGEKGNEGKRERGREGEKEKKCQGYLVLPGESKGRAN